MTQQRYNLPHKTTLTTVTGTAGAAAADKLAAATTQRVYLSIQNLSATTGEDIHVGFDGTTATTSHTKIAPGQLWEAPAHHCPQGAVSLISATGTPAFVILHGGSS